MRTLGRKRAWLRNRHSSGILSELSALSNAIVGRWGESLGMDENIPIENKQVEPAPEAPTADAAPSWAVDKFKRNTVVGGAGVAGAVLALVGASLIGGDERGVRVDFRGGPPGMQGGPGMQDGGPQGDGQYQHRGPEAQGQVLPNRDGTNEDKPKQSGQSDSQ